MLFSEVGVVVYSVMKEAYGRLALEDNSEVGEAVLGRCSISCVCTSAFYLPAKEADSQHVMGPSGRGFGEFSYLWSVGVASSIPGRTNCKRAWIDPGIPLYGVSDQPLCPRAKLAACQPMVCCEPCLLAQSGKWDFFERPLPVAQLMLSLSMYTVTEGNR